MTGLDIEAIRSRWEKYGIDNRASGQVAAFGWNGAAHASAGDVPALLAEEAGAEIRDARAATADALQVIADLRGETP